MHSGFINARPPTFLFSRSPSRTGLRRTTPFRRSIACLADGTEFGELLAGGLWSATPHSLEIRKRIFKAKRLRQLRFGDSEDPVQAYLNYKRGQSKRSRQAASEVARIKEHIRADQRKNQPADAPVITSQIPFLARGPAKAKRLRIAPGYA